MQQQRGATWCPLSEDTMLRGLQSEMITRMSRCAKFSEKEVVVTMVVINVKWPCCLLVKLPTLISGKAAPGVERPYSIQVFASWC